MTFYYWWCVNVYREKCYSLYISDEMMKVLFVDNLFTRNLSRQDKILVNKLSTKRTFMKTGATEKSLHSQPVLMLKVKGRELVQE